MGSNKSKAKAFVEAKKARIGNKVLAKKSVKAGADDPKTAKIPLKTAESRLSVSTWVGHVISTAPIVIAKKVTNVQTPQVTKNTALPWHNINVRGCP